MSKEIKLTLEERREIARQKFDCPSKEWSDIITKLEIVDGGSIIDYSLYIRQEIKLT